MFEINMESWEQLPPDCERLFSLLKSISYPPYEDGEPERGKFYRLYPGDYFSGNNTRYHGNFRVGDENLVVFFNGGGVSFDEHSVARPNNAFTMHQKDTYYSNDAEWIGDYALHESMCAERKDNPFADWSFIHLPYANGDFHCGDGEFGYTAQDGSRRKMKYHGYRNAMAVIRQAKQYMPAPKRILIAGVSAGGFGTALLSDSVISLFPDCRDITVCVDSSLLFADWNRIAREVWHTPEHIQKKLTGNNLTLDCMTALHEKYGSRIKLLFMCSLRDGLLVQAQNALDGNGLIVSTAAGERFMDDLKNMCAALCRRIPDVGLYIFDVPMENPELRDANLTEHCLLNNGLMYTLRVEGVTPKDWLMDAVQGGGKRIGLELLKG